MYARLRGYSSAYVGIRRHRWRHTIGCSIALRDGVGGTVTEPIKSVSDEESRPRHGQESRTRIIGIEGPRRAAPDIEMLVIECLIVESSISSTQPNGQGCQCARHGSGPEVPCGTIGFVNHRPVRV